MLGAAEFGVRRVERVRRLVISGGSAGGLLMGAALNMRLCGDDDNLFGRIELVSYEGVTSDNLFPAARPPATGSRRARDRGYGAFRPGPQCAAEPPPAENHRHHRKL